MPTEEKDKTFLGWVRSSNSIGVAATTAVAVIVGTVTAANKLVGWIKDAVEKSNWDILSKKEPTLFDAWANPVLYGVQIPIMLFVLAWTYSQYGRRLDKRHSFPADIDRQANRFSVSWMILILVWIMLDTGYCISGIADAIAKINNRVGATIVNQTTGVVMTFVTLGQAVIYGWMYSQLTGKNSRDHFTSKLFPWACMFMICSVALLAGAPFFQGRWSLVQLGLLQAMVAMSLNLLVGRIDSRFVETPAWVLFVLRIFALSEIIYPFALVPQNARVTNFLVFCMNAIGLGFKVIMILLMSWLLELGVIHRFLMFARLPVALGSLESESFVKLMKEFEGMASRYVVSGSDNLSAISGDSKNGASHSVSREDLENDVRTAPNNDRDLGRPGESGKTVKEGGYQAKMPSAATYFGE